MLHHESYFRTALQTACADIGAVLEIEPEFQFVGRIIFKNKRVSYFRGHRFDLNAHGSCLTAQDKSYTAAFLKQAGFKTPDGFTFFSRQLNKTLQNKRTVDDACVYAAQTGYPLILKPNDMSGGALVTFIDGETTLRRTAARIFKHTHVALLQPLYHGHDYRVLMLDGQVMAAYQRRPLSVTGNRVDNIKQLLQTNPVADATDRRITKTLQRHGHTLQYVPAAGEVVRLLDNANLSTGGTAIDLTASIHTSYATLARDCAAHLNLRLAGIDFLASDLTKPADDYVILEVNAAPGLKHYAALGPEQRQRAMVFYRQIVYKLEQQYA